MTYKLNINELMNSKNYYGSQKKYEEQTRHSVEVSDVQQQQTKKTTSERPYNTQQRLNSYRIFFADQDQQLKNDTEHVQIFVQDNQLLDQYYQELKKIKNDTHKIQFLYLNIFQIPFQNYHGMKLSQPKLQQQGYIAIYKVSISCFILTIRIYNIHQIAPQLANYNNNSIQIKRRYFNRQIANKIQIQTILYEYSLHKICSFLGVGPQILFINQIDLICYNNCLQFYLEKCQEIKKPYLDKYESSKDKFRIILDKYKIFQNNYQNYHQIQQHAYSNRTNNIKLISIQKLIKQIPFLHKIIQQNSKIYFQQYYNQIQNIINKKLNKNNNNQQHKTLNRVRIYGYSNLQTLKRLNIVQQSQNYILGKCEYESQERYNRFLKNEEAMILTESQILLNYKIHNLNNDKIKQTLKSYSKIFISQKYAAYQKSFIVYDLIIGRFKLQLTVLILNQHAKYSKYYNKLGKGSFGSVSKQLFLKQRFAAKRILFNLKDQLSKQFNIFANPFEFQEAIKQYALNKICSYLKIGPAVYTRMGFDLICFNDCIEFYLQICDTIESRKANNEFKIQKMREDIKKCVSTLHKQKIIHKDIKCDNILYSRIYKKYVLSDFGLSHPIKQQNGQKSFTFYQGTPKYMSKDMMKLKQTEQKGVIDLYFNDKQCLKTTFGYISNSLDQSSEQSSNSGGSFKKVKYNSRALNDSGQVNEQKIYEYIKLIYLIIEQDLQNFEVVLIWSTIEKRRKKQIIGFIEDNLINLKGIQFIQKLIFLQNDKQLVSLIKQILLIKRQFRLNVNRVNSISELYFRNHIKIEYMDEFYMQAIKQVYKNSLKQYNFIDKIIKNLWDGKSLRKRKFIVSLSYVQLSKLYKLGNFNKINHLINNKIHNLKVSDKQQILNLYKQIRLNADQHLQSLTFINLVDTIIKIDFSEDQKKNYTQFNRFLDMQKTQKNILQIFIDKIDQNSKQLKCTQIQCQIHFQSIIKSHTSLNLNKSYTLQKFITYYFNIKTYQKCIQYCTIFISQYQSFLGKYHFRIAQIYYFMALSFFQLAKFKQSFQISLKLLQNQLNLQIKRKKQTIQKYMKLVNKNLQKLTNI